MPITCNSTERISAEAAVPSARCGSERDTPTAPHPHPRTHQPTAPVADPPAPPPALPCAQPCWSPCAASPRTPSPRCPALAPFPFLPPRGDPAAQAAPGGPSVPSTPCSALPGDATAHPRVLLNHATTRGLLPPLPRPLTPAACQVGTQGDPRSCALPRGDGTTQEEAGFLHCPRATRGGLRVERPIAAPRATIPVQVTQPGGRCPPDAGWASPGSWRRAAQRGSLLRGQPPGTAGAGAPHAAR